MHRLKAFTLVELLVVIAVISLLMALLLPALERAGKQAKAVVCRANLKQWAKTLAPYVEDSQGRLPGYTGDAIWLLRGLVVSSDGRNKPESWNPVDTEGIACCPMAVRAGGVQPEAWPEWMRGFKGY